MMALMKHLALLMVLVGMAGCSKPAPTPIAETASKIPQGPAPALAPGFPPTFPDATISSNKTDAVPGGWQRVFTYSAKGKAADIISFYRKELLAAGLQMMAEGGGTYGAMLRAQDKSGKRTMSVDVDAPEDAPKQAPTVKVVIFDTI